MAGVKVAVRSLMVVKDKELCVGCQKPNKTRYMIIDKDKRQASAFKLAQRFYGLPFAAVDQNQQTFMCRICYRLIQKYYTYTERAKQIKESLQQTSAQLETIIVIKQKVNKVTESDTIALKNIAGKVALPVGKRSSNSKPSPDNIRTRSVSNNEVISSVSVQSSPGATNLNNLSTASTSNISISLHHETPSPNKTSTTCRKRSRRETEDQNHSATSSSTCNIDENDPDPTCTQRKQYTVEGDLSENEEFCSDKEGTEEPKVKYRVIEQLEEATYTKADVIKSLEKLSSPGGTIRINNKSPQTYFQGRKRVRQVKYRSLALAEMYEEAIKSLADGSVRKAIRLVAKVSDSSKRRDFQEAVEDLVNAECKVLEKRENSEALRYSAVEDIKFENMLKEVKRHCPILWACLVAAANGHVSKPNLCDNKVLAAIAILLQNRNGNINAFQTFISLMAKEYHIKKEGLNILNQFGITLSSKTTYSRMHHSVGSKVKVEVDDLKEEQEEDYSEMIDDEDAKTVVDHTYCTQEEMETPDVPADMLDGPADEMPRTVSQSFNDLTANAVTEIVATPVESVECAAQAKQNILEASLMQLTGDQAMEGLSPPNSPEEYLVGSDSGVLLQLE